MCKSRRLFPRARDRCRLVACWFALIRRVAPRLQDRWTWLPAASTVSSPPWRFNGRCLSCEAYDENYEAKDDTDFSVPRWPFASRCVDCSAGADGGGLLDFQVPNPSEGSEVAVVVTVDGVSAASQCFETDSGLVVRLLHLHARTPATPSRPGAASTFHGLLAFTSTFTVPAACTLFGCDSAGRGIQR